MEESFILCVNPAASAGSILDSGLESPALARFATSLPSLSSES